MSPVTRKHMLVAMLAGSGAVAVIANAVAGRYAVALALTGLAMLATGLHSQSLSTEFRRALFVASIAASAACCALLVTSYA